MNILQSWKQSLSLLLPSNFLAIFRSTLETYKVLCTQWMAISVVLGMSVLSLLDTTLFKPYIRDAVDNGQSIGLQLWAWGLLISLMRVIFILVTCAAARPSVGIKNNTYFMRFSWHFMLLTILIVGLGREIAFVFKVLHIQGVISNYLVDLWQWLVDLGSPLLIVYILFFLDSDGAIVQLWRAVIRVFTMMLYNLPLFIIMYFVVGILNFYLGLISFVSDFSIRLFVHSVVFFLSQPLFINIWTNLYIKKKHAQPDLYID